MKYSIQNFKLARPMTRVMKTAGLTALALVAAALWSPAAHAGKIHIDSARIGCLDIQHAPNLTGWVGRSCNGKWTCSFKAPTPNEYRAAGVHAKGRSFCTQAMEITYDCGDHALRNATVPGDAWGHPPAQLECPRSQRAPAPSPAPAQPSGSGNGHELRISQSVWSALLQSFAIGLRVHINNFDRSNRSPLTCVPSCPCHNGRCSVAYHALKRNSSYISYYSPALGHSADFTTHFTPQSVWRNPFLFLVNDTNLEPSSIQARSYHGQIIVDLPFEGNGREIATACHSNLACGWGQADGNNKPNAEINNLVIHVPFRLSLDRSHGQAHIRTTLGRVTFSAYIRRAGMCYHNALVSCLRNSHGM